MIIVGNFEVKFVAVVSRKMKLRTSTSLGNRFVPTGGKMRALIVLLFVSTSGVE